MIFIFCCLTKRYLLLVQLSMTSPLLDGADDFYFLLFLVFAQRCHTIKQWRGHAELDKKQVSLLLLPISLVMHAGCAVA